MSQRPSLFDDRAEAVVLSALLNGAALPSGAPRDASDFSPSNELIFRAVQELERAGEKVNLLTVSAHLGPDGKLEAVGGAARLAEILSTGYHGTLLTTACETVSRLAYERVVLDTLKGVQNLCEAGDASDALAEMREGLAILDEMRPDTTAGGSSGNILAPALLNDEGLAALQIEPRQPLLGDWFMAGDYGVIFGRRGLGKSWLAMGLARALAEGRDFGPWKCSTARRVLYVDGEMALDDYRRRVNALSEGEGNMLTLSHQAVFDAKGKALCLSDRGQQEELTRLCEQEQVDVLFLDNGACLFRGVAENDADDFRDKIEGWILDLRRRGIAVVLVLHAGRNGNIRGTSKKEDAAFWILQLDDVGGGGDSVNGARFISRFVKNRNAAQEPPPLDWHFEPDGSKTLVTYKKADAMALFRQWVEDGLNTCGAIAKEMNISEGTVSKLATRAMKEGWLKKVGREYALV